MPQIRAQPPNDKMKRCVRVNIILEPCDSTCYRVYTGGFSVVQGKSFECDHVGIPSGS